MFDQFIHSEPV